LQNVLIGLARLKLSFYRRRLVAYVGGLDLTDGRYDTPDFPLFSTLFNEHREDFRNGNAPTITVEQGPREPWHDIHARVEGPVAHDVYLNFTERWNKQVGVFQVLKYPIAIFIHCCRDASMGISIPSTSHR
jgi:phosphatidylserine/phosphatidylglycerophosphate/cardiolipin synthase-like enzyme